LIFTAEKDNIEAMKQPASYYWSLNTLFIKVNLWVGRPALAM
jgi:hypothetical protein